MNGRAADLHAAEIAAGLLPADVDPGGAPDDLRTALGEAIGPSSWWRSGAVRTDGRSTGDALPSWSRRSEPIIDIDALASALDAAIDQPTDHRHRSEFMRVRIESDVDLVDLRTIGAAWSTPVVASFTSRGSLMKPLLWRWPLRVGVVGPSEWLETVQEYWHHSSIYDAEAAVADEHYEIIVVGVDDARSRWTTEILRSATCVIAVGDGPAIELMDVVDSAVRPVIAVGISAPPEQWWVPFIEALTHDCPIDVAVDAIWRLTGIDATLAGPEIGLDVTAPARWLVNVASDHPLLAQVVDEVADWDWSSEGGGSTETSGRARASASTGAVPMAIVEPRTAVAMGDRDDPVEPGDRPAHPGRFVHAVIDDADGERLSLVADRENVLRCWIGPDRGERAVSSDAATPRVDRDLILQVDLVMRREVVASGSLFLPRGEAQRSSDCSLHVPPLPAGRCSLELAFTHEGRMYELVSVLGDVVHDRADDAEVPPLQMQSLVAHRQIIDIDDRASSSATLDTSDDDGDLVVREFGQRSPGVYDLHGRRPLVEQLMRQLYGTEKSLVRRRVHGPQAGDPDPDWTALVREVARHGWMLHRSLIQQGFGDPGDRFEVINRVPDTYVPVELLYDRGAPAPTATVDAECMAAMARGDDDCGRCHTFGQLTDAERDENPRICPFGFWSLGKVIERHDPVPAGPGTPPSDPNTLISGPPPPADKRTLRALDTVLAGWSDNVLDDDQVRLKSGLRRPERSVLVADDWTSWRELLDRGPSLLVALPHHDRRGTGKLEIRGDTSLRLERALDTFVRVPGNAAPPVLVLLGCESDGATDLGHPSFAREFSPHASVVIGTLSKVLGRHAVPFAEALVDALVAAQETGADIGVVMRDVRRRMFANGYLMALGVISLGDADWRLAKREGDP